MNWSQAGSIADVVSGIAVIISLIYLSIQIRDNTKAARANAFQGVIRSEMELAAVFIENAAIWDKVVQGKTIADGEEMRIAIMLYNMFMLDTVRRYRQYSIGYLEAQAWEARRKTLPSIVKLPIFKEWRKSYGAHGQAADFLELLDDLASRPDGQ
ncbi:MAG: hypothetical protein P8126_04195 [Gammaproteobacteria bacterium]|jgi:hypothetical protein